MHLSVLNTFLFWRGIYKQFINTHFGSVIRIRTLTSQWQTEGRKVLLLNVKLIISQALSYMVDSLVG